MHHPHRGVEHEGPVGIDPVTDADETAPIVTVHRDDGADEAAQWPVAFHEHPRIARRLAEEGEQPGDEDAEEPPARQRPAGEVEKRRDPAPQILGGVRGRSGRVHTDAEDHPSPRCGLDENAGQLPTAGDDVVGPADPRVDRRLEEGEALGQRHTAGERPQRRDAPVCLPSHPRRIDDKARRQAPWGLPPSRPAPPPPGGLPIGDDRQRQPHARISGQEPGPFHRRGHLREDLDGSQAGGPLQASAIERLGIDDSIDRHGCVLPGDAGIEGLAGCGSRRPSGKRAGMTFTTGS